MKTYFLIYKSYTIEYFDLNTDDYKQADTNAKDFLSYNDEFKFIELINKEVGFYGDVENYQDWNS